METLVPSLKEHFAKNGFNIVEPFMVNDYNNACKYKLNNLGNDNAMGLIIGCNKDFWSHFTRYIESLDSIPKDPMNSFCFATIENVLATNDEAQKHHYDVRYDWNSVQSGKYAHMQTAGHFAGVAYYDRDVMWSIHPVYGLWFVFRAIVVFDVTFTASKPVLPESLFSEETKQDMVKWTNVAIDEGWSNLETRLKIRDSCPLGRDKYRYEGDTFDYFYPIKRSSRSVLEAIMENKDKSDKKEEDGSPKKVSVIISNNSTVSNSVCCKP